MSISDPPRPTTTPPAQTRFTASLDKLSSTSSTRNSSKSTRLPGGIDYNIPFPDLPLKSLHSLFTEVIATTLPSALSLFLIVYLSSPHTRTDGLRGYVPVCVVLGRMGGEVGRRRLGLSGSGSGGLGGGGAGDHGGGEYGLDQQGEGRGDEMGFTNSDGGDDEEKQNTNTTSTSTSNSTSSSPSPPTSTSSSNSNSPSTSPSTTTTRFRGRKAEILSGALEAALVLGLSMAVSGNGNGNGNGGVGLGLLSLIGTPRRHTLNPTLLLVSLIATYTSYTLYGGAPGVEWTTVLGALGVVVLDAGRRWAGLGAVRGNLGVGTAIALTAFGTILIHPLNAPTLAAIFVLFFVILVFALNPPKLVSSPGPKQKTVYRELAVCTGLLGVLQGRAGGMWVLAGMFGLGWVVARQDSQRTQQQQQQHQLLGEQQNQIQDRDDDGSSSAKRSRWARSVAGMVAFVAVMISLWRYPGLGMGTIRGELGVVTGPNWRADVDFELALSHYDEPVEGLADTIRYVQDGLPRMSSSRVTVYSKKLEGSDRHGLQRLLKETKADEVVALANVGREGETYLQHIARRYSNPRAPLARQTFFLQPHLAWDWVAKPRLKEVHADTGFISFGPYLNASCTGDGSEKDSHGMSFPRISQIYAMFNGDLCPSTGFSVTWAGQFLASRKRIQDVPLQTYLNLLGYFDVEPNSADPKAWIWKEQWWNAKPSDPTIGHWLERSWPSVFRCSQLDLADCGEQPGELCQCRDRVD